MSLFDRAYLLFSNGDLDILPLTNEMESYLVPENRVVTTDNSITAARGCFVDEAIIWPCLARDWA